MIKEIKQPRIVIAGGGTGGHVFPAMALAREFIHRLYRVTYYGSSRGLEAKLLNKDRSIHFKTVLDAPLKNKNLFVQIQSLWKVSISVILLMVDFIFDRPKAVLGVGGYVSAPPLIAAWLLRIPICIQEQNASVGITNRLLGKLATRIYLGFESAKKYFDTKKCYVFGNPVREFFFEPQKKFIPPNKLPILLVLGGSQGAHTLNTLMLEGVKTHGCLNEFFIIHQTGKSDFENVTEIYKKKSQASGVRDGYLVFDFIEDIPYYLSNATIVVSRSGALTVSELVVMKKPAILVPYPRKGQNDQFDNAKWFEDQGYGRMVLEGPDIEKRFWNVFFEFTQKENLIHVQKKLSSLTIAQSAQKRICSDILDYVLKN